MPTLPAPAPPLVPGAPVNFQVALPAGGVLHLQGPEEVTAWNESAQKYEDEYTLSKQNDLIALGALLQQQIILYRSQRAVNGVEPEVDAHGVPTGRVRFVQRDAGEMAMYQKNIITAAEEIRNLEKSLGIDKKTREQGGQVTVASYVRTLKRAGHARGMHISKRMLGYEKFIRELEVRLRILYTADEEDRKYHNITAKTVLNYCRDELAALAELDKKFNKEIGKMFVGQL